MPDRPPPAKFPPPINNDDRLIVHYESQEAMDKARREGEPTLAQLWRKLLPPRRAR